MLLVSIPVAFVIFGLRLRIFCVYCAQDGETSMRVTRGPVHSDSDDSDNDDTASSSSDDDVIPEVRLCLPARLLRSLLSFHYHHHLLFLCILPAASVPCARYVYGAAACRSGHNSKDHQHRSDWRHNEARRIDSGGRYRGHSGRCSDGEDESAPAATMVRGVHVCVSVYVRMCDVAV